MNLAPTVLSARLAFERELFCRWPIWSIAYGCLAVSYVGADRAWRAGWDPFASLVVMPVLAGLAAVRMDSPSDSWWRALPGRGALGGRVGAHVVGVGFPAVVLVMRGVDLALTFGLVTDTSRALKSLRDVIPMDLAVLAIYVLGLTWLYLALSLGRALMKPSRAIGGLFVALGAMVGSAVGSDLLVDRWPAFSGVPIRMAILVVPMMVALVWWERIGLWGAAVGRRRAGATLSLAGIGATVGLVGLETWPGQRPIEAVDLRGISPDGDEALYVSEYAPPLGTGQAWIWRDGDMERLDLPGVQRGAIDDDGNVALVVGDDDGWRAVLVVDEHIVNQVSIPHEGDAFFTFSRDGHRCSVLSAGKVAVLGTDGTSVTVPADDFAWLGDDFLVVVDDRVHLYRGSEPPVDLSSQIPDARRGFFVPLGDGTVGVVTWQPNVVTWDFPPRGQTRRLYEIAGDRVEATCRDEGCPGLAHDLGGFTGSAEVMVDRTGTCIFSHSGVSLCHADGPATWLPWALYPITSELGWDRETRQVVDATGRRYTIEAEHGDDAVAVLADGTIREFGLEVVDHARDGTERRRSAVVPWVFALLGGRS